MTNQHLPLSEEAVSLQQAWMLDFLSRNSARLPFFHINLWLQTKREPSRAEVEDALRRVLDLHDSFGYGFVSEGSAWRKFHRTSSLAMDRHDARGLSADHLAAEIAKVLARDSREAMAFDCPPLMRCRLWEGDRGCQTVTVVLHHLIADGWSTGLLTDALDAALDQRMPSAASYQQFIDWQRDYIHSDKYLDDQRWWAATLDGTEPFVLDKSASAGPDDGFSTVSAVPLELHELAEQAVGFTTAAGTTLLSTLFTAFAIVLAEAAGLESVVLAVPSAGRPEASFERTFGYFSNNILVRADLEPSKSFAESVVDTQFRVLEALDRSSVHWDLVSRQAVGSEALGRFKCSVYPDPSEVAEASWRAREVQLFQPERADLHLAVSESSPLAGDLWYRPERVSASTAVGLARRFREVLRAGVGEPDLCIGLLGGLKAGSGGMRS